MKRNRHRETRVWHDPLVSPGRKAQADGAPQPASASDPDARPATGAGAAGSGRRRRGRIIAGPATPPDAEELSRQHLLERLLAADGPVPITSATEAYLLAGHVLPDEQEVHLQLLEHRDEERVREAIDQLAILLVAEPPRRRAVLESRLRRIEEYSDEAATQQAASALRRQLGQIPLTVAP